MTQNVVQFSDKFFIQLTGTAMGTPPAPIYATLYFAIHELKLLRQYKNNLKLYKCYIDDVLGIWIRNNNPILNASIWKNFIKDINDFGILEWDVSDPSSKVDFLDLTINILPNQKISTDLFEKPINLHLFLNALSCHPPHCIKGTIIGMIIRYKNIITDKSRFEEALQKFFFRLTRIGYPEKLLNKLFNQALSHIKKKKFNQSIIQSAQKMRESVIFHLPFNPADPPSYLIQQVFKQSMLQKNSDYEILPLITDAHQAPMKIRKMIIAYLKQKSLRNLLFPQKFDNTEGPFASYYLNAIQSKKLFVNN